MTDLVAVRITMVVLLHIDLWLIGLVLAVLYGPEWAFLPIGLSMLGMLASMPKDRR